MTPVSVLSKATELRTHARRLSEGEKGEEQAKIISREVTDTRKELNVLKEQIQVARALARAGAPPVDLADADDGFAVFAAKAVVGPPPPQAFRAARTKIKTVTARLTADVEAAWSLWSAAQLRELPVHRIPLLAAGDQSIAHRQTALLGKLARSPRPGISGIIQYENAYAQLNETLSALDDPSGEVISLLVKIDGTPSLTLGDLADSDVAMLRKEGFADQIMLRRKNA